MSENFKITILAVVMLCCTFYVAVTILPAFKSNHHYILDVNYLDGSSEQLKHSYYSYKTDTLILDEGCIERINKGTALTCGVKNFKVKSHITE